MGTKCWRGRHGPLSASTEHVLSFPRCRNSARHPDRPQQRAHGEESAPAPARGETGHFGGSGSDTRSRHLTRLRRLICKMKMISLRQCEIKRHKATSSTQHNARHTSSAQLTKSRCPHYTHREPIQEAHARPGGTSPTRPGTPKSAQGGALTPQPTRLQTPGQQAFAPYSQVHGRHSALSKYLWEQGVRGAG